MENDADPRTGTWWWCLAHQQVEPYEGCRSATRLGPYPTGEAAAEALERAAERNQAWENDPRYQDPEEAEDEDRPRWGMFS
jgi:hypothetical protein